MTMRLPMIIAVIAIVAAVVVIAVVLLLLFWHGTGGGSSTTVESGAVPYVLSSSQFQSMIGPGGKYVTNVTTNTSVITALMARFYGALGESVSSGATFLANVTKLWASVYALSGNNGTVVVTDITFRVSNSGQVALRQFADSFGFYNYTLSTAGSLSYLYVQPSGATALMGYDGDLVTLFSAHGALVPQNELLPAVSGVLP